MARKMEFRKAVFLGITSRVFRFWFAPLLWIDVFMVLSVIPALVVVLLRRSSRTYKYHIWLYALPFLVLAVISMVNANANFGQPLAVGLLTESRLFYPLVIVGIIILFPRLYVSDRSLFFFASVLLATYAVFHFGVRSGAFTIRNELMVGFDELRGGRVKLNLSLPVILSAYLLGKNPRTAADVVFLVATFLIVIFLLRGRLHVVALILPVLLFAVFRILAFLGGGKVRLTNLLLAVLFGAAFISGLVFSGIVPLISKAFDTLLISDGSIIDTSAVARIEQAATGWGLFTTTNGLGFGKLSNQTGGGFPEVLGYFHFEDLGILGVLMVYGYAGVLIYSLPIVALFLTAMRSQSASLILASVAFSIFWFTTGESMLYSGLYFLIFLFLCRGPVPLSCRSGSAAT